jgi:lathosterol oxidase
MLRGGLILASFLSISVRSLPGVLTVQIVGGLALYFGLASFSHWWFFIKNKERYFADEPPLERPRMHQAMRLAVWSIVGNAILATPFHLLALHGRTKLYYRISDRGWGYYALSFLLFLLFTETCVYWAHRLLHHRLLYRHLHSQHHAHRISTPWVSMAFHPLDSFLQAVPHYLCPLIIPVHVSVYAGFVLFLMLWSFLIHDRVTFVPWKIINYTSHHTLHHLYGKYNLGQFLTLWDRLGGSYRDPTRDKRFPEAFINAWDPPRARPAGTPSASPSPQTAV